MVRREGSDPAAAGWTAVSLAFLLLLPGTLAAQFPGGIQGRVVDADTGHPLSGVAVFVSGVGLQLLTSGDGAFLIRALPPGNLEIQLQRLGYETARVEVRVRNGRVARVEVPMRPRVLEGEGIMVEAERSAGQLLQREAIAAGGGSTLGDVLAQLPGATVVRRGPGGSEELRLRGGSADQVLVLVDGVALNDPITGVADLSTVAATELERVQVLPGARSARFGPRAMTGVVLIQTRGGGSGPGEGELQLGSLGARGAALRLEGEAAGTRFWSGGRVRSEDGRFRLREAEVPGGDLAWRENADLRQHGFQLGAERNGGTGRRMFVRMRGDDSRRGVPGKSFAPSDSARQSHRSLTTTGGWERAGRRARVETRLHHELHVARFSDPAPPLGPPFDDGTRMVGLGGTMRVELRPVPGSDLLVGTGAEMERRILRSEVLADDGAIRSLDGALGVWGEWTVPGLPGRPEVSGALRMHRDGLSDAWLGAHDLTLRVGSGGVTAHLAHRSSFSPPSPADLFFREGVGIRPNPELRPERVPSEVEVGVTARHSAEGIVARVTAEVFSGPMDDMIVWAPDFRFVWSPRNVDVRRRGGHLEGELQHPGTGWRAGGHVAATRVTYRSGGGTPGAQVMYRPRYTGGASLGWRSEAIQVSLDGRYTGARFPVPAEANALEPFWTVHLSVGGRIPIGGWTVEPLLRVDRLLDERSPFIHAMPEPGRTAVVHLRLRPSVS
jgi:vitamin B12 transporter